MSNIEVILNLQGIKDLRNSEAIQEELRSHAERVANQSGISTTVYVSAGKTRAHANILSEEGNNNELLRALH